MKCKDFFKGVGGGGKITQTIRFIIWKLHVQKNSFVFTAVTTFLQGWGAGKFF